MSAAGGCYQRVTANGILQLHQWFIGQYVNNYVHQAPGCLCDCVVQKQESLQSFIVEPELLILT